MVAMSAAMLIGGSVAVLAQDPNSGHIGKTAGYTIVAMILGAKIECSCMSDRLNSLEGGYAGDSRVGYYRVYEGRY